MIMRSITNKKILVTGATGFIGSKLSEKLIQLNAKVYAVSRREISSKNNIIWFKGDLADSSFVDKVISEIRPDYIFHLASHVVGSRSVENVLSTFKNNLEPTVNLLIAVQKYNCKRIIITGSFEEGLIPINGKIVPSSPYAVTKIAKTNYAKMFHALYNTPVSIASLFMVYGPGQIENKLVPYVILKALKNEVIEISSGKRMIDWIYVDDVVLGLIKMLVADGIDGKIVELGSGSSISIKEIVKTIVKLIDPNLKAEFGAISDRQLEQEKTANTNDSFQHLNWKTVINIEDGLKETIKYYSNYINKNKKNSL